VNSSNDILLLMDRFYINDLLDKVIEEEGYLKRQKILDEAKASIDNMYKREIERIEIFSKLAPVTAVEIEAYYNENKENYKENENYKPLADVSSSIADILKKKREQDARTNWKINLFKEADVKIDKLLLEESLYYVEDIRK